MQSLKSMACKNLPDSTERSMIAGPRDQAEKNRYYT